MITTYVTTLRTALAAVLLAVVPETTFAQGGMLGGMQGDGIGRRPFKIVVDGGLTLASGDLGSRNENGFHVGASIIYKLPWLPIAFRPEFTYTALRFKQSVIPSHFFDERNYTRTLTALGHIELPFKNGVYVFGGLGAMNLNTVLARDTTERKGTALMMDVGAGFRMEFGPIHSFLEARFGSASADEKKFVYSRASIVPLSFGFVF